MCWFRRVEAKRRYLFDTMRNKTQAVASAAPTPLLTTEEVAELCKVSVRTVENWIERRMIAVIKVKRVVRFRWAAVEERLMKMERRSV
jgi:excisionase family DNA binding protein